MESPRSSYINVKAVTFPDLDPNRRYIKFQDIKNFGPRYYIRCNEIVLDSFGNKCYCNMKPQRADRFRSWLEKNNHRCFPGEVVNQRTLEDTIKAKDSTKGLLNVDEIHKKIAVFVGKYNLSLETFSSNDFYELSIDMVAFGMSKSQNKYTNDPLANARFFYYSLSRDKLRQYLVKEAYAKHSAILRSFADVPYACVAIDEGTTMKCHNLHMVLECPQMQYKPYPFETIKMKGGTASHYVESISTGLKLLSRVNINVGSMVGDGNTAQKKAFSFGWNKSLRFQGIEDYEKMIFIPCLCHRVNNAYKSQALKNIELCEILNVVHEIEDWCQENEEMIEAQCPSHCPTRWLFDYDIVIFILKFHEKIEEVSGLAVPLEPLNHLKNCLVVLKKLISFFEKTTTKFQWAFTELEKEVKSLTPCTTLFIMSDRYIGTIFKMVSSSLKYCIMAFDEYTTCSTLRL